MKYCFMRDLNIVLRVLSIVLRENLKFIKLPSVFETFVLFIVGWPLKSDFTVL